MQNQRCSPEHPVAILSLHSHSDRSFLDDRDLALLSGALRDEGIANDLVLAVISREAGESEVDRRLAEVLSAYDPIVYERVWSPVVIESLRRRLPGKVFIGLRGEHVLLESAPADLFCNGDAMQILAPLIEWLRGRRAEPPGGVLFRRQAQAAGVPQWVAPDRLAAAPPRTFRYAPNLRPVIVNPESLPAVRTFSVVGNGGCPYQLDARENPLYAGTKIPDGYGRGCAFCVTGNHFEGRPAADTAASVLEQIRYLRTEAPEIDLLVLKDQNPFGYLTELIESCEKEGLTGFSLLLETRAEWFLRNRQRFDRALEVAGRIGVRLAPFLVGIENFSQAELDRFNKGISVERNVEFLETLWRWKERYGEALDLAHAAFGFILFTPWTSMGDLEANLAGIRRTGFDRLRGSILLSRVRLYPDTALYYLAERDGLLADEFASGAEDAARRYGYYPSRPWRFANPDVAHLATLATEVAEQSGGRDMVHLFQALLDEFRDRGADWPAIGAEDVWRRYRRLTAQKGSDTADPAMAPANEALRQRFARLVRPLPIDGDFAGGWRIARLSARRGRVEVELTHELEPRLVVEIVRRGRGPRLRRSRHYDIRTATPQSTAAQRRALDALCSAIVENDR